jgi:predicted NAD/FAD-dependent oxidoreductase
MLLPRLDLHTLFPLAASRFIEAHGGAVRCGARVAAIASDQGGWRVDGAQFDAVVVATPPPAAAALLAGLPLAAIGAQLAAFDYEPITTCYLQYPAATRLDLPFYALLDRPAIGHWGQFVFDRGQLNAADAGLLAVVVSASGAALEQGKETLAAQVAAQLGQVLRMPALAMPQWSRVISEKRATFACTPDLQRPSNDIGIEGLALAGDYTASDYPATLESAVRSGTAAAHLVL